MNQHPKKVDKGKDEEGGTPWNHSGQDEVISLNPKFAPNDSEFVANIVSKLGVVVEAEPAGSKVAVDIPKAIDGAVPDGFTETGLKIGEIKFDLDDAEVDGGFSYMKDFAQSKPISQSPGQKKKWKI